MNIANIFGLHLNCNVKVYNATAIIKSVFSNGDVELLFAFEKETSMGKTKDCKLLLKPLSAISEEDKAEFQKKFGHQEKIITFEIYKEKTVLACFEFSDFDGDPMDRWDDMSLSEIIWLASKGYDVGIVPDEYKEIVE